MVSWPKDVNLNLRFEGVWANPAVNRLTEIDPANSARVRRAGFLSALMILPNLSIVIGAILTLQKTLPRSIITSSENTCIMIPGQGPIR